MKVFVNIALSNSVKLFFSLVRLIFEISLLKSDISSQVFAATGRRFQIWVVWWKNEVMWLLMGEKGR